MFKFKQALTRISHQNIRLCSSKIRPNGRDLVENVVESDDKSMFIAWHPNLDFPYELSKPIPPPAKCEETSLLKDTALSTAMRAFRSKHPEIARQELMNLTHTTKHRWFPRSRDKKAKKTPMDRPYL